MTEIFSDYLTLLIAVITVSILVLQYFLAKKRWRLDLYDKRYPVYLATMEYLSSVMQHTNATDENLFKFLRNSRDKEFLFGKDIQDHLQVLYEEGMRLNCIRQQLQSEPVGKERSSLVDRSSEILD